MTFNPAAGIELRHVPYERLVWGSAWPHTSFAPDALPDYANTRAPVARVLYAAKNSRAWCQAAGMLYA